jgi:RTX calcium-binding nonapeptide repeat (4 copies)
VKRLAVALVAVFVVAGSASAATIRGTARSDLLVGGRAADVLLGLAGNDRIAVAADGRRDDVRCGRGRDIVMADALDRVAADCEVVSRQISRDTTTAAGAQHQTQVEPDVEAFGQTLVAVFQNGRYLDGGAADIGFATSSDGGRTWRGGTLPSLAEASRPAGTAARATDPVVAYDAAHGVWLASTLLIGNTTRLGISRSPDGLTWSPPVDAAAAMLGGLAYDKQWLACDNGAASPFRGRCYLAYSDFTRNALSVQSSSDGGQTWAPPVSLSVFFPVVGAFPVVQPDGALTIPALRENGGIEAVRSTDGGTTFAASSSVGSAPAAPLGFIRAVPIPAAAVDAAGRIVVVWFSCALRPACVTNDVLVSTSPDGSAWSPPLAVRARGSAFTPTVAAGPGSRLTLVFHALGPTGGIDVWQADSQNGLGWTQPQRLSPYSLPQAWIANTGMGRMLGDYVGTAFAGIRAVPVFALSTSPVGGAFRQSIFARVR